MERKGKVSRKTRETKIELEINLNGRGKALIETSLPFLNHMLETMARHGLFDITLKARGDINVDAHHTVEDIGITLGMGFKEALSDKIGIKRFGNATIPMDEALAQVAVDISGRSYLIYNIVPSTQEKVGNFDVTLIKEFFQGFSSAGDIALHINVPYGNNMHHIVEAIFKGVGKVLNEATSIDPSIRDIPSTKGTL